MNKTDRKYLSLKKKTNINPMGKTVRHCFLSDKAIDAGCLKLQFVIKTQNRSIMKMKCQ